MKKTFQIIGLISLITFSFFITEKTAMVVNNMDDIMINIKTNMNNYNRDSVDATIDENTIIPGISSRQVNIKKSYKNMKINGYYDDKLYVYDYKFPSVSLQDNKEKYIINGNKKKRMVSLIFLLKGSDNIDNILTIINNYNIKVTFFVDYVWFTNNSNLVNELIKQKHNVEIFMNDYSDSSFEWMDMVLKNVHKQNYVFCYYNDSKNIDNCTTNGDYIVKPYNISSKIPLLDIKKNVDNYNLLTLENTSILKKELSTIIIYIKSKGYTLTNLDEHLIE